MDFKAVLQQLNKDKKEYAKGVGTPLLVLAALGMVILPLPPFLLDILFSFNIALALVVLLVTVYTMKPLEFGMFPAVLLIATIMRLALNVASTRVVLLEGHNGGDAAGKVIEAFGSVVIGGNYAVGLVVFLILIIINFVVITKGAGRISEVSARFTLDAMPGKQMAIDADLNAGFISAEQARERRSEVTREADFYGSMDGASKFVKGDAIAGIVILIINIVGGLFVGMIQHDLSFSRAMEVYTLLTIGDGLVAQLPSLLLSIGTAIVVTRQNESHNMGEQFKAQLGNEKSLFIASGILIIMGLVPGMPHIAFLSLGALLGYLAYFTQQQKLKAAALAAQEAESGAVAGTGVANKQEQKELGWDDVQQIDVIGLEVGYRLIPLVDQSQGGELLNRIKGVRKKLSQELGFLVPPVHIRDNLELDPNAYRITMMGVSSGEGELKHGDELAINPGQVFGPIKGVETKDPAFGLDAVWIKPDQKDEAQSLGYTVVDSATVVATHISQLLTNSAALLLGHEEVQNLLDMLAKSHPRLVEGLVPEVLPLTTVVKVLQNLLNEGVAIRDMRSIVQTLVEYGPRSQDADVLTAAVRISLRRLIVQDAVGMSSEIPVITLAPELEQMLHQSLQNAGDEGAGIEPSLAERLQTSLNEAHQNQEMAGEPSILLTSGMLRTVLSRFVKYTIPGLRVMSYQEVPDERQIKIVSSVGQQ
ncbi:MULTISPECIES: flagellar biosynthesis protein FlhA [Pseudoalteromonas]|jgi:flagellar biosynthesis protein FlhA|uniref:Flagellar biosynthesis protein FlhA n=2 Tax=Pseudoalteromonas agarivorans TaxID=176102 RepID=A0ABR5VPM1_9GAMM|nr:MULTISPECIES: flagellar biosynthesis protein FlhA [Pseudoalteromonas]MDC9521049.1 flagellar biosynthesis protein FlhA [Pseudoalteromonas sp. Angola-31]ATC81576.1 flagellar biosynthesis protein FlhA [Pseudoalteromonas agarivorans DSM 14585]AZN33393.1 flagellar biosynthesis protein FlhA [Pseudoalteromonas sp. Xi13]ETJ48742.1 flagellar biosynthesis protein FlhA [Pseudoalteromonas agarivorans]KPV91382.1 Flagellar biosynthesis protein FlhA [Pseudoalteromonas sp. P1-30]|tara:strand:- start:1436 stop:3547 length:2112 start_codon:yes stop_codon:yes gene_type:complete